MTDIKAINLMKVLFTAAAENINSAIEISDKHWKFNFPCSEHFLDEASEEDEDKEEKKDDDKEAEDEVEDSFTISVELHELDP